MAKRQPMKRVYKLITIDITKQVDRENELQFVCSSKKELKVKFDEYFAGVFKPNIKSIEYFQLKTDSRKLMRATLKR